MSYANTINEYNNYKIRLFSIIGIGIVWVLSSIIFLFIFTPFKDTVAAHASNGVNVIAKGLNLNLALKTQQLITDLGSAGITPVIIGSYKREFFTPTGTLIALEGSNLSVFEYSDNQSALLEASSFQKSAETPFGSWKKSAHLYVKGNLTVLYMGERTNVIDFLGQAFGDPLKL